MNQMEDLLKPLLNIETKILRLYYEVYLLEDKNNKYTYEKKIQYIKLLSEIETEEIQKLPINDLLLFINYLKDKNNYEIYSDFSLIINDKYDNYIEKRLYNHLKKQYKTYLFSKNNHEQCTDLEEFIYQDIYKEMLKLFIYYVEQAKFKNKDYQDAFSLIKYLISFLDPDIEQDFINKSKILDDFQIAFHVIPDMYGIDDNDLQRIINFYYFKYIRKEIRRIGQIDENFNDYEYQKYKLLLQKALIQAFININPENIYLKKAIYDKIKSSRDEQIKDMLSHVYETVESKIPIIRSERLILDEKRK